jgi:hypothetical protein
MSILKLGDMEICNKPPNGLMDTTFVIIPGPAQAIQTLTLIQIGLAIHTHQTGLTAIVLAVVAAVALPASLPVTINAPKRAAFAVSVAQPM